MRPCGHDIVTVVHSPKYSLQIRDTFPGYDLRAGKYFSGWQSAHMLVGATTHITTGPGRKRDCLTRLYTLFLAFTGD